MSRIKKKPRRRFASTMQLKQPGVGLPLGVTLLVIVLAISAFCVISGCAESETEEPEGPMCPVSEVEGHKKITKLTEEVCYNDDCDAVEIPGQLVDFWTGQLCDVTLESSFLDITAYPCEPNAGGVGIQLGYKWECPDDVGWLDVRAFAGQFEWFPEEGVFFLNFYNGAGMAFDGELDAETSVLTYYDYYWGLDYTMQLFTENAECPEEFGACYTNADCSGEPRGDCVSVDVCEATMASLGWTGSWESGGACVEVEPQTGSS